MKTHPAFAILKALKSAFPNAVVHPLDVDYALLTEFAWHNTHRLFAHSMFQQGLPEWLAEKGDCDDWAWLLRGYVIRRNWHQSESRVPVAIFYLHYTTRQGIVHAINCAVVRRGDNLAVLPIEPQPHQGGPFEMTTEERASVTLVIG